MIQDKRMNPFIGGWPLFLLMLSGCSAMGDKESILPQEGASMKEVYDAHFKHSSLKQASAGRAEIGPKRRRFRG